MPAIEWAEHSGCPRPDLRPGLQGQRSQQDWLPSGDDSPGPQGLHPSVTGSVVDGSQQGQGRTEREPSQGADCCQVDLAVAQCGERSWE